MCHRINYIPKCHISENSQDGEIIAPQQRQQQAQVQQQRQGQRGRRQGQRGRRDKDPKYKWEKYPDHDPFINDWLPDFNRRRGILVDTTDFSEGDYFKLFFPNEAFQLIAMETNRYASQFLAGNILSTHSRYKKWKDTNVFEIQAYIALQIAMGISQKNELEDYWGTYWLTYLPFTEVMSRNRFELLTSFLHFADNQANMPARGDADYDELWKIRPLIDICDPTYLTVYGPGSNLSIDESIIKYKGRIHFKQYLPSKPCKWGIKQYALCESKTGYALKFITYFGKNSIPLVQNFTVTESICLSLLDGFDNFGFKLFTDNYYTSPDLFNELEQRKIGACGTVKAGRKHMPNDLHPKNLHLKKGDDPEFMRCNNMVACAWHDTKRVHFLSTIHTNNTIDKRIRSKGAEGGYREVEKPVIVETYNHQMSGVDILDQKLGTYQFPHKSSKWYFTIYHRIREVALVNGYIVYSLDKGRDAVSARVFRERAIDNLLEGYNRETVRRGRPSVSDMPSRLTERHFIAKYDNPKYKPDCIVCSERQTKRKQTNYKCKQCNKPMCFMPCHEIYHTYKDYRRAASQS